ncbi:MAG TPA: malto-oligosyltrehalose synthase [Terriglobales bacterium]|jgi:(1->4)-alpha-D-glucan 1-alpha-D-glucosylmutase
MVSSSVKASGIPVATYRLQLNRDFTFAQATEIVPYLAMLGISHCYASPYLRARPGSLHGYDIIDHNSLNPEIGTPEDYEHFVSTLHEHGMGQILDIVPNHMGIMESDNAWWLDVLENGEASIYADYFDIDWEPLKEELQGKVLVPVLGDQYGTVLDRGELKLSFDKERGEFSLFYFQHRFPINPREYPRILNHNIQRLEQTLGRSNANILELQSLIAAFGHLPSRAEKSPEQRSERLRDKEIHKRRLATLCEQAPEISSFIEENARAMTGVAGDPASFEALHELIKSQAYRLAYWRVAADDINYRRFFDVNELAGLRQENDEVFQATHRFVLQLVREGKIDGLRIDHPDGLYDPARYFSKLQESREVATKPRYVLIEKILTGDEAIPADWPVSGTTGYEFANLVNGLFVDSSSRLRMDRIYRSFVGEEPDLEKLVHQSKKTVMDGALTSELNVLANSLSRIALANRHTCDFTLNSLRDALSEVAACFPVYRTYIAPNQVSASDRTRIEEAVVCAKRRSTAADTSVFDFIREVLLTRQGEGRSDSYRRSIVHFAMKFQQFTGALMAKGLEDTTFYRYHRLVSLNEVGGAPQHFGVSIAEFHAANHQRLENWPATMLATSTHDTKRSEDVRVRINVLSEIPLLWRRKVRRWRDLNADKKRCIDGVTAPSRNDEYFFYQTLVGVWPANFDKDFCDFTNRITDYMIKSIREAKVLTSWANQNLEYEAAVSKFVSAALLNSDTNEFLADFLPFQTKIALFGALNSLSQTLLKLTVPGVPDIYQGNELFDFSLVDPDNRRRVDYIERREILHDLRQLTQCAAQARSLAESLTNDLQGPRSKMYVTWRALSLRQQNKMLFEKGKYIPLRTEGTRSEHVVSFARQLGTDTIIVVIPRLSARLVGLEATALRDSKRWEGTHVVLPEDLRDSQFRNAFTSEPVEVSSGSLAISELLAPFPVALLTQ